MDKPEINFPKGTLVYKSQPFVHVVATDSHKTNCDFCLKQTKNLRRCGQCMFCHYCDEKCQENAWNAYHNHECLNIKKIIALGQTPNEVFMMISRVIYKLKYCNGYGHVEKVGDFSRRFKDLKSHSDDIKKDDKRIVLVKKIALQLQQFLSPHDLLPFCDILEIYGRCQVNGVIIRDDEYGIIGTAIYLGATIFGHSCRPNAVLVNDGIYGCVYLTQDIKVMDCSKIFISYTSVDLRSPTNERREDFKTMYFRECACARCLDVKQDDLLRGFRCANAKCKGIVMKSTLSCVDCKRTLVGFEVTGAFSSINICINALPRLNNLMDLNRYDQVLKDCKYILSKVTPFLHPLNYYYFGILDSAYHACVRLNNTPKSFHYAQRMIPALEFYYGKYHPVVGILMLRTGKAAKCLKKRVIAREYLINAFRVLNVTHGVSKEGLEPYRRLLKSLTLT